MNRRSLLQAFGIVAVAPVLPNIPVAAAKPPVNPFAALVADLVEVPDPLFAIAFTEGPNGERYRHHMPATLHFQEHKGRSGGEFVVEFTSSFTGEIRSVEIGRGDKKLVTMFREAFDSPYWMAGNAIRVTIGFDMNRTEKT